MWKYRAYCNFVDRVVQEPTHPWPSAFSSNIVSKYPDDENPPINITPLPSGDGAIARLPILLGNSGPVDKCLSN